MKSRIILCLGVFCLVTFLTACGGGGGGSSDDGSGVVVAPVDDGSGGVVDTVAPYVLSTIPAHNSVAVKINSAITVKFNESIDPLTITSNSFLVDNAAGGIITGSVAYDAASRTATFRSAVNLATSTTYTATITTGVEDLAGNALSQDYTWQFTTAAPPEINAIDTTPPVIVSRFPAPNAISVAPNAVISVTFNEPIDPFTINTQTLTLNGTTPVAGTVSYVGSTVLFTPTTDLAAGAVYTVTVKGTIEDLAGNPLGTSEVWNFTTGNQADVQGPHVLSVSPPDGAVNVPIDTSIVVNFDEAIKPFELDSLTFNGRPVTVTFNNSYTTVTIKPTADLVPGKTHTASIYVSDQAGNLMDEPFVWKFTTAP